MTGFIVGFLLPVAVFAVIMLAGYLKRKKQVTPALPKQWRNEFQGLDLDIWAHLGYVILKIDQTEYIVHEFCKREDYNIRAYRIQASDYGKQQLETYHPYIHRHLQPWTMGSKEIYSYVTHPSRFLEEYMSERYGHIWSSETNWWVPSDKAKYNAAAQKQKATTKKKEVPVTSVEENVVQVNFGKKDET
jgi:hypothetical protein